MALTIAAPELARLLADPAGAETLSAATGCPLVVTEITEARAGSALAGLGVLTVPSAVVIVARDPGCLPLGAFATADVILTEDPGAGPPFTAPASGIDSALRQLEATAAARPVAAASLALLLRSSAGLPVPAGLIAESAAYSALQAGREFQHWRAAHEPRQPEADTSRIRLERPSGALTITLARPARRNAVDWRMRDALTGALAAAASDPALPVILDGDGPDFCAGGDLDEFGSRPDPALAHLIRLTRSPALLMHQLAERTTACLHGACLGAGIELPAFAGQVVAAPGTRLGLPEIGLGLIPGAGGTVSIPRRIGRQRTAYLALTGTPVEASQALDWGLIDAITDGPSVPAHGGPGPAGP